MDSAKHRILVVEDDPAAAEVVADYLGANGYEVVTCSDGPTAVEMLLSQKPSLMVLDLNLATPRGKPGVVFDGFSVLAWLSRMERVNQIPTIVVTGVEAATGKPRALQAGACAYLEKPVDCGKLLLAIQVALDPGLPPHSASS
jgi:CheY-like chemotaxis protein